MHFLYQLIIYLLKSKQLNITILSKSEQLSALSNNTTKPHFIERYGVRLIFNERGKYLFLVIILLFVLPTISIRVSKTNCKRLSMTH